MRTDTTAVNDELVRQAALSLFAERGYRATTMADIGAAVGIRGPSLYRHISNKQELLARLMTDTMSALLRHQETARQSSTDPTQQLRRMVEAHVRFHAANREQAFIGNREINNLEPRHRKKLLQLRRRYETGLREVISRGQDTGQFQTTSDRLASYAILDMGMGVAAWFRPDGPHTADEIAYTYADYAIAMLDPDPPHS
jgi:AcrR family transcriptional regulator